MAGAGALAGASEVVGRTRCACASTRKRAQKAERVCAAQRERFYATSSPLDAARCLRRV